MALRTGEKTLHQIVSTVASSLDLDEVLKAVVRLMSDGSGVHACFVYLVDEGGERLVLRAASPPYERQAGKVALERGEGLAWWAAERGEAVVHPRRRARRPAHEVRARARGGEVPVVARPSDRRQDGRSHRRDHGSHRGAARVLGRRGRLPRQLREPRGRRDRERAALRGDAPAGVGARAADRARRGDRPRGRARRPARDGGPGRATAARGARMPRLPPRSGERGARAPRERARPGQRAPAARARRARAGARARGAQLEARGAARRERRADRARSSPRAARPSSSGVRSRARSPSGSRRSR